METVTRLNMTNSNDVFLDAVQEVQAVSVKLPPFWPRQPDLWLNTVEATFSLRGIKDDQTKFEYTLTVRDAAAQERVADFFDALPAVGGRYEAFK